MFFNILSKISFPVFFPVCKHTFIVFFQMNVKANLFLSLKVPITDYVCVRM